MGMKKVVKFSYKRKFYKIGLLKLLHIERSWKKASLTK